MGDFNVVFQYKPAAGDYEGCRFYSSFGSWQDFKEWFDAEAKGLCAIVETGVTPERAVQLASRVDSLTMMKAWAAALTDEDGEIDVDLLRKQLDIYHMMQDTF